MNLPTDINGLRQIAYDKSIEANVLKDECDAQRNKVSQLEQQIEHLNELVRLLRHQCFGPSSNTLKSLQVDLFDSAAELQALLDAQEEKHDERPDIDIAAHKKKKPSPKPKLPAHIERRICYQELPEESRRCPQGHRLEAFGEVEGTEELHYVPEDLYVVKNVRKKYRCACGCNYLMTAPVALSPIPKSCATPSLLSHISVSKYLYHQPLYRLEKQFWRRHQVALNRAMLADWMMKISGLIQPLVNLLLESLLEYPYIHADETRLQVLKELGRKASTKSYIWVYYCDTGTERIVVYIYSPHRSAQVVKTHLADYSGYIHCDGYKAYECLDQDAVTLVGCWAHVRTYFADVIKGVEGNDVRKGNAIIALRLIKELYGVETYADEHGYNPEQRLRLRKQRSQPIIDKIRRWLLALMDASPPTGLLGKAVTYLHNQWDKLVVFLEDGHLRLDNNLDEQQVRPIALGRRNWLFCDTPNGALANCNIYTVLNCALLNGLQAESYMTYLLEELPKIEASGDVDGYEQLLPWNCSDRVKTIALRP